MLLTLVLSGEENFRELSLSTGGDGVLTFHEYAFLL